MIRRATIAALFAGAVALAGGVPAACAQQKSAVITAKDRAEAKRLFNQAHLAYQNGEYEEAIVKWQRSYELSKEPLILESIANAFERLGDSHRALEYLKQWRQAAPWREQRTLDSRIARLQERVTAEDEEQRKRDEADKKHKAEEEALRLRLAAEQKENASSGGSKRALALGLAGGGAGLAVIGIILDAAAASRRPNKATACGSANGELFCLDQDRSAIQSSNALAIAGDAGWIAGGAAAIAGIALLAYGARHRAQAKPATSFAPWVGPGGGGAALRVDF